jgi:hypothetical protein
LVSVAYALNIGRGSFPRDAAVAYAESVAVAYAVRYVVKIILVQEQSTAICRPAGSGKIMV